MYQEKLINSLVQKIIPEITKIRQAIHQHPEIACEEYNTAKLIRARLEKENIPLLPPFLETDVVAIIEGSEPGPNITLRADIDALPLQEETGLPYASKIPNMMHACGHDGHTATLIGAAIVLNQLRDHFKGTIRFVFQPGEENVGAGKDLVDAGALKNPDPKAIFAIHGSNALEKGIFDAVEGPAMAACSMFKIKIKGKGGHGSRPCSAINPVVAASRIVDALHTIPSQNFPVQDTVLVSICSLNSGHTTNVIPEQALIQGNVRFFNDEIGEQLPHIIERNIKACCEGIGAEYEFEYNPTYITMVNDSEVIGTCREVVQELFGKDYWRDGTIPHMGSEDFSFYAREFPATMVRLGTGNLDIPHHNQRYDFNDEIIEPGILFFIHCAMKHLQL